MNKTAQYRDCILNTCIRMARKDIPDLKLSTCLKDPDFKSATAHWITFPFFSNPIEKEMEVARQRLLRELKR